MLITCAVLVENHKSLKMFDAIRIFMLLILGMSITYQPKKKKRKRKHGFLKRMKSPGGRRIVAKRRAKGRYKLTV